MRLKKDRYSSFFSITTTRRAIRRFHKRRLTRKAYRNVDYLQWFQNEDTVKESPKERKRRRRLASQFANNLQVCSCWGCGNPRKHWKEKTRQERKAAISEKEQIQERFARTLSPQQEGERIGQYFEERF